MSEVSEKLVKDYALKFLKGHNTMVLASVSRDLDPEAATVYFVSDDEFNIYFMTSTKSRKTENLRDHGKVSFVIGWGPEVITIQGGGIAKELPKKEADIFFKLIKKNAFKSEYQWPILALAKEGYSTFKVTPQWMSYFNFNKEAYPDIASDKYYKII